MFRFLTTLSLFLLASAQTCPDGWEEFGSSCYSFHSESLNWTESREFCQGTTEGADLATVKEANILRNLYDYVQTFNLRGSFWLGGSDLDFEGDWFWIDNSRIGYGTPFWALNNDLFGYSLEPKGGSKENCLAMNKDRLLFFDDLECSQNNHPICMIAL